MEKLSYIEMAVRVLEETGVEMTPREIWEYIDKNDYTKDLNQRKNGEAKTPEDTMRVLLTRSLNEDVNTPFKLQSNAPVTYTLHKCFDDKLIYLINLAKKMNQWSGNINLLIGDIKNLSIEELNFIIEQYKDGDKVNGVRFRFAKEVLINKEKTDLELLNIYFKIKELEKTKFTTDIYNSWSDFGILSALIYATKKKQVEEYLGAIIKDVKNKLPNLNTHFVGFPGIRNYGTSQCWIAFYPKDEMRYNKCPHIALNIDQEGISTLIHVPEIRNNNSFTLHEKKIGTLNSYKQIEREISFLNDKLYEYYPDNVSELIRGYYWYSHEKSHFDLDEQKIGDTFEISLLNIKKNKRKNSNYLKNAKNGDRVLIYHWASEQYIAGIGEVVEELKANSNAIKVMYIEKTERISRLELNKKVGLTEKEFYNKPDLVFFKIGYKDYMNILNRDSQNVIVHDKVSIAEHSINLNLETELSLSESRLYLENEDFVAAMIKKAIKGNKHIIFTGPPGTGKSKLAKEICKFYNVDYKMATAEFEWSTYDTIGNYAPNKHGNLVFNKGLFLSSFENKNWLIIDEINRAEIDKAFGSMFSVLANDRVILNYKNEEGDNYIVHPKPIENPSAHDICIPTNWKLIGTMNTYDKTSLFDMSYAFMRRFSFIPISIPKQIDKELIEKYMNKWDMEKQFLSTDLAKFWNIVNRYRKIGPALIKDIAETLDDISELDIAISMYVLPQFEGLEDSNVLDFISDVSHEFGVNKSHITQLAADFFGVEFDG